MPKQTVTVRTAAGKVTVEPRKGATVAEVLEEANSLLGGSTLVLDMVALIKDGQQVTADTPVGDAEETTITVAPRSPTASCTAARAPPCSTPSLGRDAFLRFLTLLRNRTR